MLHALSKVTRSQSSSLYLLLQKAFSQEADKGQNLEHWCAERVQASPQLHFWWILVHLELTVLIYVRSVLEGNIYIDALSRTMPWFFALGILITPGGYQFTFVTLVTKQASVHRQFLSGNFTVKKTTHVLSTMAIDQAHEQNNANVKGEGGAIGLTENPHALRRWMASGPEIARVIAEFHATSETTQTPRAD